MDIDMSNIKIVTYTAEQKLVFYEEELYYARRTEEKLTEKIKELQKKNTEINDELNHYKYKYFAMRSQWNRCETTNTDITFFVRTIMRDIMFDPKFNNKKLSEKEEEEYKMNNYEYMGLDDLKKEYSDHNETIEEIKESSNKN